MTNEPQRPTIDINSAPGGWPPPWPSVAELADALPTGSWTLVGGLMTQLHTVHRGLGIVRATNDVDIVLHIEAQRGLPAATATALEMLGYRPQPPIDPRNNTAHRFVRGSTAIDLVTDEPEEQVDVLIADHPAPKVIERLRGREVVRMVQDRYPAREDLLKLSKPGQDTHVRSELPGGQSPVATLFQTHGSAGVQAFMCAGWRRCRPGQRRPRSVRPGSGSPP